MKNLPEDDPLVTEVRKFIGSYAEHDPDCPAFHLGGPEVLDPANCNCGLTARENELMNKLSDRLRTRPD